MNPAGPPAAQGDPRAKYYLPERDGLRCVAFLLVFLRHAPVPEARGIHALPA